LSFLSDVTPTSSLYAQNPAQKRPFVMGVFNESENKRFANQKEKRRSSVMKSLLKHKFNVEFNSLVDLLSPRHVINVEEFSKAHDEPLRQFLQAANIPFSLSLGVEQLRAAFIEDGNFNISKLHQLKSDLQRNIDGPKSDDNMSENDYDLLSMGAPGDALSGDALARKLLQRMYDLDRKLSRYVGRKKKQKLRDLEQEQKENEKNRIAPIDADLAVSESLIEASEKSQGMDSLMVCINDFRHLTKYYLIDSMGTLGTCITTFIMVLIFWSCVMFVKEIQSDSTVAWMEYLFTSVFTIEYVMRAFGSQDPLKDYMLTFYGIIDIASIFPTYLDWAGAGGGSNLGFLRACRTMRALKFLSMMEVGDPDQDSVKIFGLFDLNKLYVVILRCVCTAFVIVFVLAGMYVSIDPDAAEGNFFLSVYFIIITVTTVGYGDYSPTNDSGRVVICLAIFACLAKFPELYRKIGDALMKADEEAQKLEQENRKQMELDHQNRSFRSSSFANPWYHDEESDHDLKEEDKIEGDDSADMIAE